MSHFNLVPIKAVPIIKKYRHNKYYFDYKFKHFVFDFIWSVIKITELYFEFYFWFKTQVQKKRQL